MKKTKNKKLKISQTLFFVGLLMTLYFFVSQEAGAACLSVPARGNYTATTSCAFDQSRGNIQGVDQGNLTIQAGATLTVNGGQTIVWNPGYSIFVNGSIAIDKTPPGGQIRKGYLWMVDADGDGYASSTAPYQYYTSTSDAPTIGGVTAVRRGVLYDNSGFFYDYVHFDYDDRNSSIYYGTVCQSGSASQSDTYSDETKISSKTNVTITGGQMKSELSP